MVRLGDICRFQSGGTPRKSNPEFFGGDIPWITTVALNGGKIDGRDAVDWITDIAIRKSATKVILRDSILVGTRVGIGKVAINSVPMATNQDVIALTGIDTTIWDKNFLCKFIQSKSDFLISQSRGATIRGIKIETLSCIQVPNIPICEQRRIAAVLDKVSDLIAKRRQQLEKLDELVKARFVEMFGDFGTDKFGWGLHGLCDCCEVLDNKRIPITASNRQAGPYPYYGANGIQDYVANYIFDDELVLLAEDGGNFGSKDKPIAYRVSGKCWVNNHAHVLKPKDGVDVDYLCYSLMFYDVSKLISGTTRPKLTQASMSQIEISVPPLELQNRFASFVERVKKTKTGITHGLERLETLKRALMQHYFG